MENQKMCDELLESIKKSQADKKKYFLEVANGKHQGKKLVEHRIVIELAEVIDYDKSKLVFEENNEDEKKNNDYIKSCSEGVDLPALKLCNEIQQNEKFDVQVFNIAFRDFEFHHKKINLELKKLDVNTGNIVDLGEIPPEIAEAIGNVVANAIKDGEVKATEASV